MKKTVKGLIISETVYDSTLDWTHGMGHTIKRLIIPVKTFLPAEGTNLVITPQKDKVYVWLGKYREGENHKVLGPIVMPIGILKKLYKYALMQKEIDALAGEFVDLIKIAASEKERGEMVEA